MNADDPSFDALWRAQHLDRLGGAVALGETVTARTVAAPSAPPPRAASITAPPLPSISLGASVESATVADALGPDDTHDLVVLATLGEGGMGKVLLARQRSLARDVAVKVLRSDHAEHEDAQALLREAVVMGGLEHPNVVPVHALGHDDKGRPVLVMKRIDGTSWRDLLHDPAHPRWEPLLAAHGDRLSAHLEVLSRVADAAHFAHARGVVHRDIKPDNVMVGPFGEVYLVDWGIALRLGRDRVSFDEDGAPRIRGTPSFMAPEMIDGDPDHVDARTDVYLLGATLHEVLTKTPRHPGANLYAVLFAAHTSEPVAYGLDVPEELAALCNDATHADPAKRPQSAQEFRRRVTEFVGHRASLTLSASAHTRLARLDEGADLDDATTRRLATEARFGFTQALEVWPANPRAKEGLARVLRRLFAHELSRENLDAATALADELGDRTDETRGRLDALAAALETRRAREAESLREAHERDFSLNATWRIPLFGVITVASALTNFALGPSSGAATLGELVRVNVFVFAVFAVIMGVARRRVLVNRITRQSAAVAVLCFGGTLAHRALLLVASPQTSVADALMFDEFYLAGVVAAAGVGVRSWLAWMCPWALAGVALTALRPDRAMAWFTAVSTGMMLTGLYFGWVRERPATEA